MKHVRESLKDYYNDLFFRNILFEAEEMKGFEEPEEEKAKEKEEKEEKPAEEKEDKKEGKEEKKEESTLKDKEQAALDIIKKITDDFEDFKSSTKGDINKYREFWEDNKKTKELFSEPGNIYKLSDSSYVVGVLELPSAVASDGSLEGGLGAFEEKEEIIEGKPKEELIEGDPASLPAPPMESSMTESLDEAEVPKGEEEQLLDDPEEAKQDMNLNDPENVPTKKPESELGLGGEEVPQQPETAPEPPAAEEPPMEEPAAPEEPIGQETGKTQTYLVVYDISGDEKDEIFRNGSTNAVKAFRDFYENTFKGTMKAVIQEFKEKKQQAKAEAEKQEKQKKETEKDSKLQKFLKK